MEKININTTILRVNADLALFKTGDIVSGVIHVPDAGKTTVIFDGGYVFGEFHCPICAIKNLNTLVCNYIIAHRNCGIEYSDYKRLHLN
ncbi:hypothetical protein RY966_002379 [Enterobacter kobei]|nr:hypothetical protein [Enterobacter kobei]